MDANGDRDEEGVGDVDGDDVADVESAVVGRANLDASNMKYGELMRTSSLDNRGSERGRVLANQSRGRLGRVARPQRAGLVRLHRNDGTGGHGGSGR